MISPTGSHIQRLFIRYSYDKDIDLPWGGGATLISDLVSESEVNLIFFPIRVFMIPNREDKPLSSA